MKKSFKSTIAIAIMLIGIAVSCKKNNTVPADTTTDTTSTYEDSTATTIDSVQTPIDTTRTDTTKTKTP